jgi:Ca2+/H+ antiporter
VADIAVSIRGVKSKGEGERLRFINYTALGTGAVMPVWMYVFLGVSARAIVARLFGLPAMVVFLLSAAGLIPMAGLIGRATEAAAHHVGPKFGGLLNATFGNAAELIIGAIALKEGLIPLAHYLMVAVGFFFLRVE